MKGEHAIVEYLRKTPRRVVSLVAVRLGGVQPMRRLRCRGIHSDGIDTSSVHDMTFPFLVAATAWCVLN